MKVRSTVLKDSENIKVTTRSDGKVIIEIDWGKALKKKPAGQQFWNKNKVKVSRAGKGFNRGS